MYYYFFVSHGESDLLYVKKNVLYLCIILTGIDKQMEARWKLNVTHGE